MPPIEQPTQVRSSRTYSDAFAAGATLIPTAAGDVHLEYDLNAIRSQVRRILSGAGAGNWYDALFDDFSLKAIHDKKLAYRMPMNPGTQEFTLGSALAGVLLPNTAFIAGDRLIAVGASSTTNRGYIAADEANFTIAGTLGVGLSTAADADGNLLNTVAILDADTDDHINTADGEEIFGLLHVVTGTADGTAIAGAGSENLEISFVFRHRVTGVITSTTLPVGDYHFAPIRQRSFYDLARGFALGGGSMTDIIDSGGTLVRLPTRVFKVSSATITSGDVLNIQTGVFTTAGAQTVLVSYGTPALPATGALFRDDQRIKVWINGNKSLKGDASAADFDVYWVSTTQIGFRTISGSGPVLFSGDYIELEAPPSY